MSDGIELASTHMEVPVQLDPAQLHQPHPHHAPSTHVHPDQSRLSPKLLFLVFSLSFGTWFPIGYSMGIVNAPQREIIHWIRAVRCSRVNDSLDPSLVLDDNAGRLEYCPSQTWCENHHNQSVQKSLKENAELNTIWALVASILPLGAFITVWSTNYLLTRFGSKKVLLGNNVIGIIGAILCGLCVISNSYEILILGRIVLGMNVGLVMAIIPLYIAEISPSNLRGMLGTFPGLSLVSGTLVAAILSFPQIFGHESRWPLLSFLLLIPFGLLSITLPFFPESPRFLLLTQKNVPAAEKALQWLRGRKDVNNEIAMIQTEDDASSKDPTVSLSGLFSDKVTRSSTFICIALMLSQQLTGIGPVLLYSTRIFGDAGLGASEAVYGTLGLMCLQIFATCISSLLMDRAGRKLLLLTGFIGSMIMCVSMVMFMKLTKEGLEGARYTSLVCMMLFIIMYNLGPAFVPWVYVSELFSKSSSGAAIMVVSSFSHLSGLVITFLFPLLTAAMEEWVFAVFAACTAAFTVFVYFRVVETKGRTFDEIQAELHLLRKGDQSTKIKNYLQHLSIKNKAKV